MISQRDVREIQTVANARTLDTGQTRDVAGTKRALMTHGGNFRSPLHWGPPLTLSLMVVNHS